MSAVLWQWGRVVAAFLWCVVLIGLVAWTVWVQQTTRGSEE